MDDELVGCAPPRHVPTQRDAHRVAHRAAMCAGMRAAVRVGIGVAIVAAQVVSPQRSLAQEPVRSVVVNPSDVTTKNNVQVTIHMDSVARRTVLEAIARQAGLSPAYSRYLAALDARVSLHVRSVPVLEAFDRALTGTGIRATIQSTGYVMFTPSVESIMTTSIQGTVTDGTTKRPVSGAVVMLEGTAVSVRTGDDGEYHIRGIAAGTYTVVVRRVGYVALKRKVTVTGDKIVPLDLNLTATTTVLNDVVTTATGEQRRLEIGNAIGFINADSLVKAAPISTLSELLTGRVPGVQVVQNQGSVGGSIRLRVRGANSINLNSDPIVVIDGVRSNSQNGPAAGPFGVEQTSRLNDLNPNDVEKVEIVKGPSAATLYGSDAANGVILITTKRGQVGAPRWNAYGRAATMSIPQPKRYPDIAWGWGSSNGNRVSYNCQLIHVARGFCQQDSVTYFANPQNDVKYRVLGDAPAWQYGANVSGGQNALRYYLSGDVRNETGTLKLPTFLVDSLMATRGAVPDEWKRPNTFTANNLRANATIGLGPVAELQINSGYGHVESRNTITSGQNGAYGSGIVPSSPTNAYTARSSNPLNSFAHTSIEGTDRFFSDAQGRWQPFSWFTMRGTIGLDLGSSTRNSLAAPGDVKYSDERGTVADDRTRLLNQTAELGMTATAHMGAFSARTSVGTQFIHSLSDMLSQQGFGLPVGSRSVMDASDKGSYRAYTETYTLGQYVEEMLGWRERLFFTAAVRSDGASSFGQNYKAAVFPKFSASWLLSNEPWAPRIPMLSELRLRSAVGFSGLQPGQNLALPQYNRMDGLINGAPSVVLTAGRLANPGLRPERVRETEMGLDATGFGERVQLGVTHFARRTTDLVSRIAVPNGFGWAMGNIGLVTQNGTEIEMTTHLIQSRALTLDLSWQRSSVYTRIVHLGSEGEYGTNGSTVEGYPLGARFMTKIVSYADANGNGRLELNEVQTSDTAEYAGYSTPPVSYTFTPTVGLLGQRVRFSALFERRSGFTQLDYTREQRCGGGFCSEAVDPTTPISAQLMPIAYGRSAPNQWGTGVNYLSRGDFTRLREVTMTVDVPAQLLRATRARSGRISVAARNLRLWTRFPGGDPEGGIGTATSGNGLDGTIPQARTWVMRFDLGI